MVWFGAGGELVLARALELIWFGWCPGQLFAKVIGLGCVGLGPNWFGAGGIRAVPSRSNSESRRQSQRIMGRVAEGGVVEDAPLFRRAPVQRRGKRSEIFRAIFRIVHPRGAVKSVVGPVRASRLGWLRRAPGPGRPRRGRFESAAAQPRALSVNQEGWRGSQTAWPVNLARNVSKKAGTPAGSKARLGGSCISTGPRRSARAVTSDRKRLSGSAMSASLRRVGDLARELDREPEIRRDAGGPAGVGGRFVGPVEGRSLSRPR